MKIKKTLFFQCFSFNLGTSIVPIYYLNIMKYTSTTYQIEQH